MSARVETQILAPASTLSPRWRKALSPTGNTGDAVFRVLLSLVALFVLGIVLAMISRFASDSMFSIRQFGFSFLTSSHWNPIRGQFGALPFIYGTVMSSLIALVISVPLSSRYRNFSCRTGSYYLARPIGFSGGAARSNSFSCLRAVGNFCPRSVSYEFTLGHHWSAWLGWTPFFRGPVTGIGLLTGGIILAIMVTPIISAVVRDVLTAVPSSQREAALALGATKWETIRVVLVNGAPGIAGAVFWVLGERSAKRWLSRW